MGRQADGCCGARTAPGQLWVWDGSTDLGPWGIFLSSQIISQIWPYLSMIMENKFREKLEPKIREKSVHLRTFAFTKLYFGQKVGAVSGGAAGPPPPPRGFTPDSQGLAPTCTSQSLGLRINPSAPGPRPTVSAGSRKAWLRDRRSGWKFHSSKAQF